uniref:Uncharacterized protein n=1 Tax=Arundo donax TaxID=35708 RepID=A0A0A8YXD7_ARUDO
MFLRLLSCSGDA